MVPDGRTHDAKLYIALTLLGKYEIYLNRSIHYSLIISSWTACYNCFGTGYASALLDLLLHNRQSQTSCLSSKYPFLAEIYLVSTIK